MVVLYEVSRYSILLIYVHLELSNSGMVFSRSTSCCRSGTYIHCIGKVHVSRFGIVP